MSFWAPGVCIKDHDNYDTLVRTMPEIHQTHEHNNSVAFAHVDKKRQHELEERRKVARKFEQVG